MRAGCKSESGLTKADFNKTLLNRFTMKCGKINERGCIPWLGGRTRKGYGYLRYDGMLKTTAHRIAWVLKRSDIPSEILVLHKCDNPSCVNPDHLFLGSPQQNTDDMVSKNRHAWRKRMPWQKLGIEDGLKISELRNSGYSQQRVADSLGVSRALISLIESGKIKHSKQIFESI